MGSIKILYMLGGTESAGFTLDKKAGARFSQGAVWLKCRPVPASHHNTTRETNCSLSVLRSLRDQRRRQGRRSDAQELLQGPWEL